MVNMNIKEWLWDWIYSAIIVGGIITFVGLSYVLINAGAVFEFKTIWDWLYFDLIFTLLLFGLAPFLDMIIAISLIRIEKIKKRLKERGRL